ncbi:ferric-dicitrate binding protein FerR (iron transport regulator) [Filimonas zeae]|uniref:Iron dicitrate transporter FecR n=1 Tax=Filimonas zeae TaxID=1737353 RepID=A0A917IVD2_9BACT|nr:FecR family protein [Filimonas zeae]MDR6339282.1 ferric-dicitrate binding protein FerR (iron transport regulator) [Filimonas zeae]GGH64305.1 iron dicitrate transporter FecR [Filimonas zeae]
MPEKKELLYYYQLAAKWENRTITAAEMQELEAWYQQNQDHPVIIPAELAVSEEAHQTQLLHKIYQQAHLHQAEATPVKRLPQRWRWVAAASVLVLATGGYFWFKGNPTPAPQVAVAPAKDIAPGKEGAILTLADGSTVVLDSLQNGWGTTQQSANIQLQNGQLKYEAQAGASAAIAYNTLSTPRGRQFSIALPDGSRVWLNAASSITFPTSFTGNERLVSVTGEAYLEVAGSAKSPFRVRINDKTTVEVLGTSFNINAYDDEPVIATTLLAGRVRVNTEARAALLKPGQQAQITPQSALTVKQADVAAVTAWKDGHFIFSNTELKELMRQLERWYDIEVAYKPGVEQIMFSGDMQRSLTLMQVIKGLDNMGARFKLDGRKLLVTPASL